MELHSIYHKSNTNCGERGKVKWVSLSLSTPLEKVEGSELRTDAPSIARRKRQFWVFNQATACLDCHLVENTSHSLVKATLWIKQEKLFMRLLNLIGKYNNFNPVEMKMYRVFE